MKKNNAYFETVSVSDAFLMIGKKPVLSKLELELTERCNNNCIHCCINRAADDPAAKEHELSTAKIKEILEQAAVLGCLTVTFTGGEPLLREDFEELYLFTRKLGLKVLLLTNATRITPHLADLFTRIPPMVKIEISIYGMKRNSYEAVTRVPGSFEAAWRGVNLLKDRHVPFIVKSAFLPPNKDEMHEFADWASTLPWMDHSPTYSVILDLRCRRDSERKNDRIKKLRSSPQEVLKFLTKKSDEYLKDRKQVCSRFAGPPGDKIFSCGAGVDSGCVDAYGNLQPCMLLKHPDTVYNLKSGSLKKAVTGFFADVRQITAKHPDYLSRCAGCFLKGLCEQCPARSWTEHGTLDTPVAYLCDVAHVQARYLGLLGEGESAWEIVDWKERIDFCLTD